MRSIVPSLKIGILLTLTFCGVSCLVFYPGLLTPDTYHSYNRAVDGLYDNFHPPIFAFVWRFFLLKWPGPGSFFIFNNLLYWSGIYIFFNLWVSKGKALLFTFVTGFWLPFFSYSVVILKDSSLTWGLLFFFCLWELIHRTKLKWATIVLIPFLFFVSGMRHNGILAGLPLAGALLREFFTGLTSNAPKLRRYVYPLCAFCLVGFVAGYLMFTTALVENRKFNGIQNTWSTDLTGISIDQSDNMVPPQLLTPGTDFEKLKKFQADDVTLGSVANLGFRMIFDDESLNELKVAWLNAIQKYPGSYLKHRLRVLSYLFHFRRHPQDRPPYIPMELTQFGQFDPKLTFPGNRLADSIYDTYKVTQNWPIWWPWPYCVLLVWSAWHIYFSENKKLRRILPLHLSALTYSAAYAVLANSMDMRYLLFPMLVGFMSFWVCIDDKYFNEAKVQNRR